MFSGEPDNGGKFSGFSLYNSKRSELQYSEEADNGDNDVLKHLEK